MVNMIFVMLENCVIDHFSAFLILLLLPLKFSELATYFYITLVMVGGHRLEKKFYLRKTLEKTIYFV